MIRWLDSDTTNRISYDTTSMSFSYTRNNKSFAKKELLQTGLINIFVQHIHVGGCYSVHNPLSPLVIFPPLQTSFPVMPLYLASVGTAPVLPCVMYHRGMRYLICNIFDVFGNKSAVFSLFFIVILPAQTN